MASAMSARSRVLVGLIWLVVLTGLVISPAHGQQVYTYTNARSGAHDLALGYPVPLPINSQTPGAFFRSYQSLHARLQALAMEHAFINAHEIGQTIQGRAIWAYTVSDPDTVTLDGFNEPAFLINGTIHAREWASPEVVAGILERFAGRGDGNGLYRYLLENANLVIIPVLNIDGFLQTQRYPARVILGTDPEYPNRAPRDGRMRRKNMRGADENLLSFNDHLNGVDLNRNNPPYAPSPRASGNPDSLIFHGDGAHNQPETQALAAAVEWAPAEELRLYTDVHSFASAFLDWLTNNTRRNANQVRLVNLAIDVLRGHGSIYRHSSDAGAQGIGSTDEYFAEEFQVPAWTLELEPRSNLGGLQYDGIGVTHDGFILPESQITRVRDEIADTYATLFYAQAGPPSVKALKVFDSVGGTVYAGHWETRSQVRRDFVVDVAGSLQPGVEYQLWLAFDKPMRRRKDGQVIAYPAFTPVSIKPALQLSGGSVDVSFGSAGQWRNDPGPMGYLRYPDDAFLAPFTVPVEALAGQTVELELSISVKDFAKQSLDADPSTVVDWAGGHWVRYEATDGSAGDFGGTDSTLNFTVSAQELDTVTFKPSPSSYHVMEGSLLYLPVVRQGEGEGAVSAEVIFESGPPGAGGVYSVSWANGETGVKHVAAPIPDNLRVGPLATLVPLRVHVNVTSGLARATDREITITVEDNDTTARGVYNILKPGSSCRTCGPVPPRLALGGELWRALNSTPAETQLAEFESVTINLADGAVYAMDGHQYPPAAAGTLLSPIQGNVTLAGHHSVIRFEPQENVDAIDELRLIHVLPGAQLTLSGVEIVGFDAPGDRSGGAILNEGEFHAERAIFLDNQGNRGGALMNLGEAYIINSSFVNNQADLSGGAIHNSNHVTLEGVTFSSNSAGGQGGAVFNAGEVSTVFSTFAENEAPVGASIENQGTVILTASILADEGGCSGGSFESGGYNLRVTGSDCPLYETSDLSAVDAGLALFDLDDFLYPLLVNSAALNAGQLTGCLGNDSRGVPRPFAESGTTPRCDIGAFERGLTVHRGLWWNPQRPGHGFDLQQTDNRLALTWFTYETDGDPVWYQAVAPFNDPEWTAELYRFTYSAEDGQATPELAGHVTLTFESDTKATFAWDLSESGQGTGSEPFEAFTPLDKAPLFDVTGLWSTDDGTGWGLSVDVQGESSIFTLYYYDGQGQPRWVQGVGFASTDTAADLSSLVGFCPDCALIPVSSVNAGSLDLQFLTRSQAEVETNITYPGEPGGTWNRDSGLFVLSDPVP